MVGRRSSQRSPPWRSVTMRSQRRFRTHPDLRTDLCAQAGPRHRCGSMVRGLLRRNEVETIGVGSAHESRRRQSRSVVADPVPLCRRSGASDARPAQKGAGNRTVPANSLQEHSGRRRTDTTVLDADALQDPIVAAGRTWKLAPLTDDQHKPRGARFQGVDTKLVTAAAKAMGLNLYEAATEDLAALAKKLPVGRLYSNGKGFVPNIRQSQYSELIATLAHEPQAALTKDDEPLPQVTSGLPRTWDEIAPGHLVIAEESLVNGWWHATCLTATATCSRCAFAIIPSCQSLCGIGLRSRLSAPR